MSNPQSQTYTPAQYLEAGYRAELAGERERAAQYYQYLAEVFTELPEGEAARAGLARLGYMVRPPQGRTGPPAGSAPSQQQGNPQPAVAPPQPRMKRRAPVQAGSGAGPVQGFGPTAAGGSAGPVGYAEAPQNPQRIRLGELAGQDLTPSGWGSGPGAAKQPSPAGPPSVTPSQSLVGTPPTASPPLRVEEPALAGSADDARLPDVVTRRARELAESEPGVPLESRYRGARTLAHILIWIGWIGAAGGLAFAVLGFVGLTHGWAGVIAGLPGGVLVGVVGLVSGLALALGGQVALAIFDQAQVLREMGIILRARADL